MVALSKSGFKISLSKFIDSVASVDPKMHVVYDKSLTDATNVDKSIKAWVSVVFGIVDFEGLCEGQIDAYMLTREDPEGIDNSFLLDKFMKFFSDPAMLDGNKRIPFYEVIDGSLVQTSTMWLARVAPLREFTLLDETKVCPTQFWFNWNGSL